MEMEQNKMKMEQNKMKMEQHKVRLELQKGVWCGYQEKWSTQFATIPYKRIIHFSTNMKNPGIGLDILTGLIACLNHVISSCISAYNSSIYYNLNKYKG